MNINQVSITNFGNFSDKLRNMEPHKNFRRTGNIIKDTYHKHPVKITTGTILAILLGLGISTINSNTKEYTDKQIAKITETRNLFEIANTNDIQYQHKVLDKAKKTLTHWKISVIHNDEDKNNPFIDFKYCPPISSGKYDLSQGKVILIKRALGLLDGAIKTRNPELKELLDDCNINGHANLDYENFIPGKHFMLTLADIGKERELAKAFYLKQIK